LKALITGSEGFIGSHLTEELVSSGYDVRCLVLYNSFGHNGWLDHLPEEIRDKLEIVKGDVKDQALTDALIRDVDIVFHLAALIAIPYSYIAAESYVETNVRGTLNVLDSCKRNKTGRVIITSTSEVYGTAKYVPIDEFHPKQAQSPYAASKIAADALAESYFRSYELPVTVVRPFNTYGPRQSTRAVIPTIITQMLSGADRIKLGSLVPTRDLVYVKDTVKGISKIAACSSVAGEEINIATGNEISIGKLAETIFSLAGRKCEIVSDDSRLRPENSEVERLIGSVSKLDKLTGWKPDTSLESGLSKTIEWFSKNFDTTAHSYLLKNIL
jgi:dTDP-glucose 4,6-dehydratase